jgi:hypothetical protein
VSDDLINVFESTLLLTQLLKDRLTEAGIEAFIDQDTSPFDGLTAANQMVIVRVLPKDAEQAGKIVAGFRAEKSDAPVNGDADADADSDPKAEA